MDPIRVYTLGKKGVVVDKDPIVLEDDELTQAQNAIREPLGADAGLKKRPGLAVLNTSTAAGSVTGGIAVPLQDLTANGTHTIYLGRSTT